MHFSRFFAILFLGTLSTSFVWSAPLEMTKPEIRLLYNIGLRTPIRLPIFYNDASILRFVSRSTPLSESEYIPSDLVSISGALINQAGRSSLLKKVARDALWDMASGFQKEFGIPLTVISGYRSAAYQQRLWDLGRCTDSLCAPSGRSEHQLGLAVDLFDASNEHEFLTNPSYRRYVNWLQNNAYLYGWTQSYQKWPQIDEYGIEPWHYRYLGENVATRLHNLGWTYTEFVRFQQDIQRK